MRFGIGPLVVHEDVIYFDAADATHGRMGAQYVSCVVQ